MNSNTIHDTVIQCTVLNSSISIITNQSTIDIRQFMVL